MPSSARKVWTAKKFLILLLSLLVALGAFFFVGAFYYARTARQEADIIQRLAKQTQKSQTDPVVEQAFTTDQLLSTLSLNVTVLGLVVGIVATGFGALALFGYNELRAATFTKTEDDLVKIIRKLFESGELDALSAANLLEIVAPERVFTPRDRTPGVLSALAASENSSGNVADSVQNEERISPYPEEL
jgi:hypothetical protein